MRFAAKRLCAELERAEAENAEDALLGRVALRLRESPARRRPRLWMAMATVGSFALVIGLYFGRGVPHEGEEVAHIDGSESSIVGRWVKTGEETRQVHFADGSNLALFPNTEVKVEAASPQQTRVQLGDGRTHVHVVHGEATDYRFQAGPFEIRVTGTQFDLAYHASSKHLELVLLEGGVVVTGPGLAAPRKVGPGEFLRLDAVTAEVSEPGRAGRGALDSNATAGAMVGAAVEPEAAEAAPLGTLAASKTGPVPATEKNASWQVLLGSGDRKLAVRTAEGLGAARLLEGGSTSSLLSLAQAARLEGSPRFAQQLLVALREARGERGQSAFYLGKIAHDQLGQRAEAQKWFETYLREAPTGTFAEQAWARLLELGGTSAQGKKWAREYLERYPSGASSARARSLLF